MTLRPYQEDAVARCLQSLSQHDRVLMTMATGLGKTVVFSEIAKRFSAYGRVLILTHRAELVWQALRHLESASPGVEMRTSRDGTGFFKKRIVVGTVQTVYRRLGMFRPETFSLVIFDEAHHCSAPTWKRIMRTFRGSKILGVTATPCRSDAQPLPGFETIAYSFPLADAVRESWLVPIKAVRMTNVTVDLSQAVVRSGDYTAEGLDALLREEEKLHAVADVAIRYANKKVLVFMPSNDSAEHLHEVIERYVPGISVVVNYRQSAEYRAACVELFREGARKIMVNCLIATEGFDVPDVGVIIVARPTRSPLLYEQMIGRGTRPISGLLAPHDDLATRTAKIAASAKPYLLVVNVRPINGQYADVANVIDPSLPLVDDALVSGPIRRMSEEAMDAIEYARAVQENLQARIAEKRQSILASCISYQLSKDGVLKLLGLEPDDRESELAEDDEGIQEAARQLGVPVTNMTKLMWAQVQTALEKRRREGLATYRQLKLLRNRGIPDEVLRLLKVGEASVLIESLRAGRYIYFAGIRVPKTIEDLEGMRRNDFFRKRLRIVQGKAR